MDKIDLTLTKKYTDREILKRTFKYIAPYKWKFILGIFLILLNVFFNLLTPRIIGAYINALDVSNLYEGALKTIFIYCIYYFIVIVINMLLTYIETIIIQKAGQNIIFTLRQQVFEKIETFSQEQLNKIPVGRLVTRVTSDTNALNELYTTVLVNLLKYSLLLIGIIVNMFMINYVLAGYMMLIMVLIIILTIIYRHYSQKAFQNERKQISNLNTFLSENLSGMKLIQTFNQENKKKKEFDVTNKNLVKAKRNVMFVFALYRPLISFLYFSAIALVFLIGFPMVKEGKVIFGTIFNFGLLISFYNYTDNFFGPIQNISEQFDKLQAGIVASGRIFNILDMESTIVNDKEPLIIDKFKGKIEFKHVYFAYENEDWVLEDVSFVINPKQTVAFVGATGSGKSTILSLIVRNYDIQKGEILIDDIDIKKIDIKCLRSKIGQMLQDVFIFSGTILDNITLFDQTISLQEVNNAIKYVNADKFILKMKDGLNTEVSEKGSNFSSGQRQLISFSRTIVHNPQILILDEATANIDTETEALIQDSLEKMKNIGTMLIVAHRLSTIQHADNIICLAKGKILEQGNHQQLLSKKGYYYKLYLLQFEKNI